MLKEFLSFISISITIIAYLPYIRAILQGKVKPHVFSWIIWGTGTFIVFLAQLADEGGAGTWPIGISGIITIYVALLAYTKKADTTITKMDWAFFIPTMASLPLWYITSDPLWAVVILTFADTLGLGPTFRKAYFKPFEEQITFFALISLRNIISIFALENYSLTTILFPATMSGACMILIMMVAYRRNMLNKA